MLDLSLPRGSESARLLLDFAAERGVPAIRCLDRTGLEPGDLEDASPEIATSQEVRIIENLVAALPDAGLGLQVAATYPLRVYGVYGFAMLSAPTLRGIVEMAVRYQDLSFTLARASIRREPPFTHMDLDASHLSPPIRSFVLDHAVAIVVASWIELDRAALNPQVELPASRHGLADAYRHALGLTPRFGGRSYRLTFSDADLDRSRVGIDRRAFEHCERECLAVLRERQSRAGLTGIIRARLERTPGRPPSMEQIAAELHLSSRSLRRALSEEGTSFRTLERSSRQHQARTMLDAGCSVADAADRLGYNDAAGFINAYKRWHGTPPGRHRRHHPSDQPGG